MTTDRTPITLWDFAVRAYAREGVAALCLRLQDEHDLDVDVLLAALWLARRGQGWDEPSLDRALEAAAPVRRRVLELRALRRAVGGQRELEPAWQPTYEHLKDAELAAERLELERLELALTHGALAPDPAAAPPRSIAMASLRAYAARLAVDVDAELERLVDGTLA